MEGGARTPGVDGLKGIVIIGIVFTHLVILAGVNREGGDEMPLILQIMYLGLMSFFMITGYFFRPGRGFVRNMKTRIPILVALLISIVLFPLMIYVWATLFGQCPGVDDLVTALMQGFGFQGAFEDISFALDSPISFVAIGCYYLWVMLFAYAIFFAVADKIYGNTRLEILAIAFFLVIQCLYIELIHLRLPFSAQTVPMATAFMLMGMTLSKGNIIQKIDEFRCREPKYWAPMVICLLIGFVLAFFFHPDVSYDKCLFGAYGGYSVFPYFLEASLFFVVFLYVMNLVTRIPVLRIPFLEMGKHTLGTLLMHAFLAKMMLMPFFTFTPGMLMPDVGKGIAVAVALIDLILCYAICRLLISALKEYGQRRKSVLPEEHEYQ